VDDTEVSTEIKEESEAGHTICLYKGGKYVGKVKGAGLDPLQAELTAGLE
jgi:hypothetical protein